MTDQTEAKNSIDAIRAQYDELEETKDVMRAAPDLGVEMLSRWEDRTARVIEANIGATEAQKFLDTQSASRAGDPRGNLGRKVRAKKAFLTALVDELRQHSDAVFARQPRALPIRESHYISAEQLKQRLISVRELLKRYTLNEAERHGLLVSRIVGSVLVLLLLSGGVILARQLKTHWDWIEPVAWVITLALTVASLFIRVPKLGRVIQQAATRRRLNRIRRRIDFDAIESIIDGSDLDQATQRVPVAGGSVNIKAGDADGTG